MDTGTGHVMKGVNFFQNFRRRGEITICEPNVSDKFQENYLRLCQHFKVFFNIKILNQNYTQIARNGIQMRL